MLRKVDAYLNFFTDKTKPLARLCKKFYQKYLAFYCINSASIFMRFISRFLNLSAVYRKKILDSNAFEKFRFLSVIAVLLLVFLFAWKASVNFVFAVILFVVLGWFIYQGYRAAYVLACALFGLITLTSIFSGGLTFLLLFAAWGIASAVWFFAFNAEVVRVNLEKSFQLKKVPYSLHKDIITAFLLVLIALGVALLGNAFFFDKHPLQRDAISLSQNKRLSLAAGTVARHLFGYQDFCNKQGYQLVIYPEVFQLKFAPHIAKIQKDLSQYDESLESFYSKAKSRLGRKLNDSIAVDIENIRRQAIIELVAAKQNTSSKNVKWNNDMSKLISTAEACGIFDEMAETILLKPNTSFQQIMSY